MKNEYRREMERLGPRQEELERLYAMIEGGTLMKRKKRLGCRAVAAIAVCAVLTITAAAAAATPAIREALAAQLGVFVPYAQTIDGAVCADQGIEIQVLSALADDLEARVYLSVRDVEGDRLNQFLTLSGKLTSGERKEPDEDAPGAAQMTWGFSSTDYFVLESYDPETRTALFSASIHYADTVRPTGEAQLSITGMTGKKAELYSQPPGENISCASVTGEVLKSLPTSEDYLMISEPEYLESIGADNSALPEEHVVLAPGQTPIALEGNEDIWISSMGFASDGRFHVRLGFADGVAPETFEAKKRGPETGGENILAGQTRSAFYCDLFSDGAQIDAKKIAVWETPLEGGMDVVFPMVTVDDLEELRGWEARVYGSYTRPGVDIEGNWSTEFELDYHPSVTLDWTGELLSSQVRQVTVSPLSVTMYSNNTGGFDTTPLYALKKDGSTVEAKPGTGRYVNLDAYVNMGAIDEGEGYDAFNTWKFEEPVDVEDIVSLTLGDTMIPMN